MAKLPAVVPGFTGLKFETLYRACEAAYDFSLANRLAESMPDPDNTAKFFFKDRISEFSISAVMLVSLYEQRVIVGLSGVQTTWEQAVALAGGQIGDYRGIFQSNTAFIAAGLEVFQWATNIMVTNGYPPQVAWAGHSWGGIAATIALRLWEQEKQPNSSVCLSLGAPRCGDQKAASFLSSPNLYRIAGSTDIVTAIPNLPLEVAAALGGDRFKNPRRDIGWQQIPGGFLLGERDITGPVQETFRRDLDAVGVALLQVAGGIDAETNPHALNEYLRRLRRVTEESGPVDDTRLIVPLHLHGDSQLAPAVMQMWRFGVRPPASSGGGGRFFGGHKLQAFIPKPHRFGAAKIDGTWWVTWEGRQIIQLGKRKTEATHLRGFLNGMLRRVGNRTEIRSDAWLQSFSEFLQAAATPGNGFNPVWPVT